VTQGYTYISNVLAKLNIHEAKPIIMKMYKIGNTI